MNLSRVWMQIRGSENKEAAEKSARKELFSDMLLGFGAAIALGAIFVLAYLSTQFQAYRNPYFAVVALLCIVLIAVGGVMLICGRLLDR
ncbi:MAG: hypothetical protein HY673_18640 [Chloroflexi bacterium]|nr:hypothetical protein [Chloroflexota bacterium]